MALRLAPEQRTLLRRGLMKRGANLAELLSQVLSGKKPPTLASLLSQKPGLRPEEALRMLLDQNEGRRKLIDADDDRFGRCDVCGFDIGFAALEQMPWADRCGPHANV